ncbi:4'-phosphopantetheinyl transferase family protein [Butyrivibrio sp. MC2021]|uniref:4'-phosphopantetheinyl transferase family protein n=1 Tax=Butyrivibrio sp. MC2021 TaxID=1408306 RepID=UPI00047BD463|nr:4'-phosphopantetheinyl transferase superfamily protein [Butyrivibrio sp. MC2021]
MGVCNKVYVYDVSVFSDRELFDKFYGQMDDKRKEKIDRFKNASDKYLSLGAGVLLKTVLSDVGIRDYELKYGKNDKPYLEGDSGLFFNLSHSGKYAIMTISDREVGIDIEKNKKFEDSLIKHIFDEEEISFANDILSGAETFSATCSRNADVLYTGMWTAKESVMKFFGIGLGMDPVKIHLEMNEDMQCLKATAREHDCSGLFIHRYELGDYQISVCSEYETYGGIIPIG